MKPNPPVIAHLEDVSAFVIRLETSFYLLRVDGAGRLLHVGFVPGTPPDRFSSLDSLLVESSCWDQQLAPFEFPAAGDLNYHEPAVRATFTAPPHEVRPGESFGGTVRDFRPRYVSHEIVTGCVPGFAPRHGRSPEDARQTLRIRLQDPVYGLAMDLFYRASPGCDVIERWVALHNVTRGTVRIHRLDFAAWPLPVDTTALTYVRGSWADEFETSEARLSQGIFALEQGGLNTGHQHNPFFLLHKPGRATEEAGTVWFGALAYSGNWSLRFEVLPSGHTRVFGGYGSYDFELLLAPGESHVSAAMILGCTSEGIGGASRRLHRFARQHVLPSTGRAVRPVLFNSWEETFFDVDESSQGELARVAADLGVELFCLDDGWFGARSNDRAGLGDWTPRADAFPNGLRPLADKVRALGMRFGLWVEPEMVNPDSDLYRAHPDWVLHYPGRPRTECRNQLILDFGRPEVVAHLLACLDSLVTTVGVDFFKWDMNRYATEPGSVAGAAIWREHVRGLYHIMDELRRRHPLLDIQSCSGGGGRVDLGILARCDQVWTSDNTDAVSRTRIQDGFSLAYPPRVMECWVTHSQNYLTKRTCTLDFRFDVAMRGALGIGTPLTRLSADEKERYRVLIGFYKRIRETVQHGELYRLQTGTCASVWLIVSPERRSAVFSSVLLDNRPGRSHGPFVLRGLDPALDYRLSDADGPIGSPLGGAQLMTLGLADSHRNGEYSSHIRSRTIFLEAL